MEECDSSAVHVGVVVVGCWCVTILLGNHVMIVAVHISGLLGNHRGRATTRTAMNIIMTSLSPLDK